MSAGHKGNRMAHPNIDERREAVKRALGSKANLPVWTRHRLASQFNCSPAAIWSDILTLTNGSICSVSKSMKAKIIKRDDSTCYLCGKKTDSPIGDGNLSRGLCLALEAHRRGTLLAKFGMESAGPAEADTYDGECPVCGGFAVFWSPLEEYIQNPSGRYACENGHRN